MSDRDWEYSYDYRGGFDPTDIAGRPTKDEIKQQLSRVRWTFNGKVPGFFNCKPSDWDVVVYPSYTGPFIVVRGEVHGDWRNFIAPERHREYQRANREYLRQGSDLLLVDDWAFLFPYHQVALVLDTYALTEQVNRGLQRLEDLEYKISHRRESNCSTEWANKNKEELLGQLRKEGHALDARAIEILTKLQENLPEDIQAYTAAVFVPGKNRVISPADEYFNEVKEHVVNPVKELVEIPSSWLIRSLEMKCLGLPSSRALGICSRVHTASGVLHIPMIDFKRDQDDVPDNELRKLGIPGMVVRSGRAGHFYGFDLLTEDEWVAFINELKKYYWVDEHWPDLQLQQGYSMLRITSCTNRLYQPCFTRIPEGFSGRRIINLEAEQPSEMMLAA
jgi:hypothetical protein